MNSRRGTIFFWIAQVLLLPSWVCFGTTLILRFGGGSSGLLSLGLATGLVQVPCAALALLMGIAAGMGELLPKKRVRLLYGEVAIAVVTITLVFLWRAVYRR